MTYTDTLTRPRVAELMTVTYAAVQLSWGGVTVHQVTGDTVPDGIDAYAVTVKEAGQGTVRLPESATFGDFAAAWQVAAREFATAPYLGVFHDDNAGTIEFDPVFVVGSTGEVDAIHARCPVVGGAYHFATGNGYWPGVTAGA